MALLVNIVDSSGAVVADGVVVVGQGSSVEHGGASASAATWGRILDLLMSIFSG